MLANSEPPLVWVSIRLRTPPTIMSPENTVALVPSEKVTVSMPQSSTSTGVALRTARSSGRRHANIADDAAHARNADRLAACPRLDLLEIEYGRKRMASH